MLSIGSRFLRRDCKENKILDNTITVHTPWGPGIVILNLLCTQLAQLHQGGGGRSAWFSWLQVRVDPPARPGPPTDRQASSQRPKLNPPRYTPTPPLPLQQPSQLNTGRF